MIQTILRKGCLGFFLVVFLSSPVQSRSANTLHLNDEQTSPPAKIEDIAWLSGHWQGQVWDGTIQQVWSMPSAGSMMAAFKFIKDDKVKFYELLIISEENNSLVLKLKHFSATLEGWEEKEDYLAFKLVKLTPKRAYFDGYTIEKVSDNEINEYVVIDNEKTGARKETQFTFKRVQDQ